jgi:hypothetical protein
MAETDAGAPSQLQRVRYFVKSKHSNVNGSEELWGAEVEY